MSRLIRWTALAGPRETTPERREGSWADLLADLGSPVEVADKAGPAWSPAVYPPGATRSSLAVASISVLVIDIDHTTMSVLEGVCARMADYRVLVHSTYSHDESNVSVRIVVDLTRDVLPAEWAAFRAAVQAEYQIPGDPQTKDLARLYFRPSCRPGYLDRAIFEHQDGQPLDVDAVLSRANHRPVPVPVKGPRPHAARSAVVPVDVTFSVAAAFDAVRDLRNGYKRKKNEELLELCERILEGRPLAEVGGRDATINRTMGVLAHKFPAGTPPEVAVEVVRRAVEGIPATPETGETTAYWLAEARDCYERAMVRRVESDAVKAEQDARLREMMSAGARRASRTAGTEVPPTEDDSDPEDDVETLQEQPADAGADWQAQLIYLPAKEGDEHPRLKPCLHNAAVILGGSPEWEGVIKWNEVTRQIEVRGGPLPAKC